MRSVLAVGSTVNAYDADCAVVTGIALDHTDWLGPTRETIGYEKAGIYRSWGKPAICADPEPPQSLIDHATTIGARLQLVGHDFAAIVNKEGLEWTFQSRDGTQIDGLPRPGLHGASQIGNAAAALAALGSLEAVLPVTKLATARGWSMSFCPDDSRFFWGGRPQSSMWRTIRAGGGRAG